MRKEAGKNTKYSLSSEQYSDFELSFLLTFCNTDRILTEQYSDFELSFFLPFCNTDRILTEL